MQTGRITKKLACKEGFSRSNRAHVSNPARYPLRKPWKSFEKLFRRFAGEWKITTIQEDIDPKSSRYTHDSGDRGQADGQRGRHKIIVAWRDKSVPPSP